MFPAGLTYCYPFRGPLSYRSDDQSAVRPAIMNNASGGGFESVPYRAVAGDVTTVQHCNTFRALNVIFRALSTSVWQKSGRLYSDL